MKITATIMEDVKSKITVGKDQSLNKFFLDLLSDSDDDEDKEPHKVSES